MATWYEERKTSLKPERRQNSQEQGKQEWEDLKRSEVKPRSKNTQIVDDFNHNQQREHWNISKSLLQARAQLQTKWLRGFKKHKSTASENST
jgi:hypothetical protein